MDLIYVGSHCGNFPKDKKKKAKIPAVEFLFLKYIRMPS